MHEFAALPTFRYAHRLRARGKPNANRADPVGSVGAGRGSTADTQMVKGVHHWQV